MSGYGMDVVNHIIATKKFFYLFPLLIDGYTFEHRLCSLVLFSLHHLFKLRYSRDGGPHQIQQQTVFRQMSHFSGLKVKRSSVIFILLRSLLGYTVGSGFCTLDSEHFQFKRYDHTLESLVLQSYINVLQYSIKG